MSVNTQKICNFVGGSRETNDVMGLCNKIGLQWGTFKSATNRFKWSLK